MTPSPETVGLLLIKPSHYDDDGYVIQWWRSFVTPNVLTVVAGLINDADARQALGPNVRFETRLIDEASCVVRPAALERWLADHDHAAVMLVGVQTSQFPRALDIARPFTAAGFPVIMGGFHVSGALKLVPEWAPAFQGAREAGVSLYAGELEGRVDALLADIVAGTVEPLYTAALSSAADLAQAPPQRAVPELAAKSLEGFYAFETGRGCPFQCTFCCIINVHGNTIRHHTPEAIEAYLREVAGAGGRSTIITDDNFSRSPIWRDVTEIMTRLHHELKVTWSIFIQIDMLATRIPGFVDACRAAGVTRVFIGMESVRADNLAAAGKGQNKVHQMRDAILTWKRAGIMVMAGYIIGFRNDTPERVAEDIRTLQDMLPVDIPDFFLLSPLPGSEDHRRLVSQGVAMDDDLNRYDMVHCVTDHPVMKRQDLEDLYWRAWRLYYTRAHLKTVIARGLQYGQNMAELRATFVCTLTSVWLERVHPIDCGAIRIRDRLSRRPGLPVEPALRHAVRCFARNAGTLIIIGGLSVYAYAVELRLRWKRSRMPPTTVPPDDGCLTEEAGRPIR